jgi:NAD(P)-dependent dehydrogenase (short-subunit alcohol dehydrogenase family)
VAVQDFTGKVAVVTGGASGIGEGLARALLDEGARVVIADVERAALDAAVDRLGGGAGGRGAPGAGRPSVMGIVTDVSDPDSVEACAEQVYGTHGVCHLLFNNAGVGGGGVAKPWNWTPNDWRWCLGVNVFGVAHGVQSFVPRMLAGGEEGWVVNTSSGNGGVQPLADLALYAASKAAVTAYTEALENAFLDGAARLHAAVFYPGGNGLLETNLWNSGRNRPPALARERPHVDAQWDYAEVKAKMAASGVPVADLVALGRSVLDGIRAGRFVLALDTAAQGDLLRRRAERIGLGMLPTLSTGSVFERGTEQERAQEGDG